MIKTVVVLPAYNAEKTLKKVVAEIPESDDLQILLVDDASVDGTVALAKQLGIKVFEHDKNKGYGGNQKTCYRNALDFDPKYVVMLHPDYQYDPKLIPIMIEMLEINLCDVVLGSRIRSREEALKGGMPFYKYISNRFLTLFQNFFSGQNLSEWHTGMRAFKSEVLRKVDYSGQSDDFVFDTQMLFNSLRAGFKIGEIHVPVRYFPEASSINFMRSCKYGLLTVWETLKYSWFKLFK
ncbi:MAG: glycosyltransferase family 2 protein [Candidatus Margulisbacteria bacterium]|nr:glycosyltransferase family 2 protein [Candidatus Margulisiibacteriota bacterium]